MSIGDAVIEGDICPSDEQNRPARALVIAVHLSFTLSEDDILVFLKLVRTNPLSFPTYLASPPSLMYTRTSAPVPPDSNPSGSCHRLRSHFPATIDRWSSETSF